MRKQLPNEKKFTEVIMKKKAIPQHLAASTRKWVKSVCDNYELEDHQFHLLILAGEALDRSEQARLEIQANGMTFDDKAGQPKPRPEVAIELSCKDLFRRLLRELNLSEEIPESRPPRLGYGGK